MNRFEGYNRNDYHFNRTSREAFGRNITAADFEDPIEGHRILKRILCLVVVIASLMMLSGWAGS